MKHGLFAVIVLVAATGCASRLQSAWIASGYDASGSNATKHIKIAAWAEDAELARLTARIASERVKFKKNYLVYDDVTLSPGWASACARENEDEDDGETSVQGVLAIRMLEVVREENNVELKAEGRLMRCSDGAMLWRAEVAGSGESDDEDLATFAESYAEEFPGQASSMAIPLLVNLIALLDALPDVVLTEEEEFTKIELSVLSLDSRAPPA